MMSTFRSLLSLILFIPFWVCAKTPSVYISKQPDWVVNPGLSDYKPSIRDVKQGYFLSQIEQQVHVEKQASYTRIIREIVNESGIQNGSEISVSFDPTFEKVDFHSIKVWRKNQAFDKLQLKNFKIIADEEDLSRFIYQGTYSAYIILDDIRKGDRIEFSYTITGRNPIFKNKYSSFIYLQEYKPVSHNYTSLIASSSRKLNLKYFNGAAKAKISTSNGTVCYQWESFKQKAVEYEDDAPNWFDNCPNVQISEYSNWAEVSRWANEINPVRPLTGDCANYASELKEKFGQNKEQLFRAATQFVQDEVRYMGIEMGAYSHQANLPEKVFKQRYGDCKDKALLLASILQAAGIDAEMVLVSTVQREHLKEYLPTPKLFDHAVLRANVNGKIVYVDATMQYQGGRGSQIYFPDYRCVLVINNNTKGLTDIAKSPAGKTSVFERYLLAGKSLPAQLTVKTVYTLGEADDFRSLLASKSISDREKEYLKYYQQSYPKIKATDTLVVEDDKVKNELITIEKYSVPDFFQKDSVTGELYADFYASEIKNVLPKIKTERKQPLWVNTSAVEHHISVVMDGGWNIDTRSKSLDRKDYKFHSYYSQIADTLNLEYQFQFLKSYISPEQTSQLVSDMQQLKDEDLSYSIQYRPDDAGFYPNYNLIAFCAVLILIFVIAGYLISNQPTADSLFEPAPIPIGGWLIIVIISLAATILKRINLIVDDRLLDLNTWNFHNSRQNFGFYKVFMTTRVFTEVYIACFSVFCLLLISKRRDILPGIITFYYGSSAILLVVCYILSTQLYGENSSSLQDTVYKVVMCFALIAYFKSSDRVKDTFVMPCVDKEFVEEEEPEEAEAG